MGSVPVMHRARWVVADPFTIYEDGHVLVERGIIKEVGNGATKEHAEIIDYGEGAIFASFVNAHTHLELCALKGQVSTRNGFQFWVKELIQKRELLSQEIMMSAASKGLDEMTASGCWAAAEISSLGQTLESFTASGLSGVWFREYLGNSIPDTKILENKCDDVLISLAGHAPHTTSPEVLVEIKQSTRRKNLPFSIHLAESEEEMIFLTNEKSPWKDFLLSRGIDTESWGLPVESPVKYMKKLEILDEKTLLVHLLHVDKSDLDMIKETGCHVCLCPRSNHALHERLPDLNGMLNAGIKLCLGTDSLASVDSLNMFDEMVFICKSFPSVLPEKVFHMATLGGASALGLDKVMGTLTPGKRGRMAFAPVRSAKASNVVESMVNGIF